MTHRQAEADEPDERRDGTGGEPSGDHDPRLRLAFTAFKLKDEARAGWVLRSVRDPESVADHSWGTALLCLLYAAEAGVDEAEAVRIAVLHDLAEAETGDVIARASPVDRTVSEESKAQREARAIETLLSPSLDTLRRSWQAYEDRSTPAALFVRDMNLIDMCMQAVLYQEQQRYDPGQVVPSQDGYTHLDEFFVSARSRLSTGCGRRLYELLERRYEAVR